MSFAAAEDQAGRKPGWAVSAAGSLGEPDLPGLGRMFDPRRWRGARFVCDVVMLCLASLLGSSGAVAGPWLGGLFSVLVLVFVHVRRSARDRWRSSVIAVV